MAGQTEVRARTCPGFGSAGIRIDQTDDAIAMFAIVMAYEMDSEAIKQSPNHIFHHIHADRTNVSDADDFLSERRIDTSHQKKQTIGKKLTQ